MECGADSGGGCGGGDGGSRGAGAGSTRIIRVYFPCLQAMFLLLCRYSKNTAGDITGHWWQDRPNMNEQDHLDKWPTVNKQTDQ